jgi:hypothetical protein
MVPWIYPPSKISDKPENFAMENGPAYFVTIASDKYEKFYIIDSELELYLAVTYPGTTGWGPQ